MHNLSSSRQQTRRLRNTLVYAEQSRNFSIYRFWVRSDAKILNEIVMCCCYVEVDLPLVHADRLVVCEGELQEIRSHLK